MRPAFLDRLFTKPSPPVPEVLDAAHIMYMRRVNRERNRVIDKANEMRAAMGMDTMIPRRTA